MLGLGTDEVHAWVARPPALTESELAECAHTLSAEERARVARFRFERNQREATVSRALVRTTLARYVDLPASSFRFRVLPLGRPELDPPCGLAFNATNHPDLVACAVARIEQVGIDTEPLSRGDEILEVAEDVFSSPELEELAALSLDERRDRAVALWTCKEAYIKARGLGFSASLKDVVVDFTGGAPQLRFLSRYDEAERWWLATHDLLGFRLAIAVRAEGRAMSLVVREAVRA